jgi:hypothetical protein
MSTSRCIYGSLFTVSYLPAKALLCAVRAFCADFELSFFCCNTASSAVLEEAFRSGKLLPLLAMLGSALCLAMTPVQTQASVQAQDLVLLRFSTKHPKTDRSCAWAQCSS